METIITLNDTTEISAQDATVTVDLTKLSAEIVAKLVMHGLRQKIADAAAGASTKAAEAGVSVVTWAESAMQKVVDNLVKGNWGADRGVGVSDFTRVARQIVRDKLKAKYGTKSDEWKAFLAANVDVQNAKLDEIVTANAEALKPVVDAEIERRKREAAEKAAVKEGLTIAL